MVAGVVVLDGGDVDGIIKICDVWNDSENLIGSANETWMTVDGVIGRTSQ